MAYQPGSTDKTTVLDGVGGLEARAAATASLMVPKMDSNGNGDGADAKEGPGIE